MQMLFIRACLVGAAFLGSILLVNAQSPLSLTEADLPSESEVKMRVDLEQLSAAQALEKFQVSEGESKERRMVAIDDGLGSLRMKGIKLRIRKERGQETFEASVKLLGRLPREVPEYLPLVDFKCEVNVSPSVESSSCTFSSKRRLPPEVASEITALLE
jgi:hypothetical protein